METAPPTVSTVLDALHRYHRENNSGPTLKELAECNRWPIVGVSACLGPLTSRGRVTRCQDGTYLPATQKAVASAPVTTGHRPAFHKSEVIPETPVPLAEATPTIEPNEIHIPRIGNLGRLRKGQPPFHRMTDEDFVTLVEEVYRNNPDHGMQDLILRFPGVSHKTIHYQIKATFDRMGKVRPAGKNGRPKPKPSGDADRALLPPGVEPDTPLTLGEVVAALVAVDMPDEARRAVVERLVA